MTCRGIDDTAPSGAGSTPSTWPARCWASAIEPIRRRRRARELARHHTLTGALARAAVADRIRAGEHLGAAPYGYRIRVVPGDPHALAARGVLIPDESTTAVVRQIFTWRTTDRIGPTVIAQRLTADPQRYPPPRRADGTARTWTRGIVRHILTNPVYIGHRTWGRTRQGRPTPARQWVASPRDAYPPLVDQLTFTAAQRPLSGTEKSEAVAPQLCCSTVASESDSSEPHRVNVWRADRGARGR